MQGSAVAFTVTPAVGSRLSAGGLDTVALSTQDTVAGAVAVAVAKILGVFGTRWANDNHDVQVTYQGHTLKAGQLAQMRWILAQTHAVGLSVPRGAH